MPVQPQRLSAIFIMNCSHACGIRQDKFRPAGSISLSNAFADKVNLIFVLQVLDEAKDSVTSVQVSDYEILTGSADCRIRRYDMRVGRLFADFIGSKEHEYKSSVCVCMCFCVYVYIS